MRFDLNDYSVPHTQVRKTLTVFASLSEVRIVDANVGIAQHQRCFDKHQRIERAEHLQALLEAK